MDELKEAVKRKMSFWQTLRAVFWSFIGLRKGAEHDRDMANLNPIHVIVAGVLGAVILVVVLIGIVRLVVGG
ncbi:DUF2970 domain-containing protein [Cupriavidus gilardii]|uniref:DUF2970 domain-containing protein n=1 Tax=Cupriavidus gilardii TaxID=82541 RepID=A0A6N1BN13_9BURK|nr:DUF2970 domain-containing protein [Cupriavidus gilardii]ALD89525.1 hypothetical protein CR3_0267 [Cupriavidus gilardii CR3]QQE07167.1 DUF2970 domain-containing protein [Cupriavidus sp. ISTL7]KAB0595150.1 DUF2970 domain-containing protein [Cupriavidus gilardii]MCT9016994.1 DUF2970 domain-containing protein [Cupriavidus gilardii]MCT9056629.1 DUF2970 domain-containing protein [Cupriavidus gilardii]